MPHLGEKGKDINEDIAALVKKGLSADLQKALDILRVVGNNAVHPAQLSVQDDPDTANSLFDLVNWIAEELLTRPRRIREIYAKLPAGAQQAMRSATRRRRRSDCFWFEQNSHSEACVWRGSLAHLGGVYDPPDRASD